MKFLLNSINAATLLREGAAGGRGEGGRNPAAPERWGGKRLVLAKARRQSPQKLFPYLIEKILRAPSKKCFNFCGLCPPSDGEPPGGVARRRRATSQSHDFSLK
jgi:hypothetical protein